MHTVPRTSLYIPSETMTDTAVPVPGKAHGCVTGADEGYQ